jgi:hypothetical protein
MQKYFILTVFFLIVCSAHGQVVTTPPPETGEADSVRRYYIKQLPKYFFLYPVLKQRSLNFELEKEDGPPGTITFKPNNSYSFGLGMYLFEFGFELTFAVPLEEKSISVYGESKARDIQFNLLGKKWGADAYFQKYKGFYVTDSKVAVAGGEAYPQRPDIVTQNIGLTGNYVFNNQRFSFRAAYNFSEEQIFSKGSLLMFSSISSFKLDADSSIINKSQEATFGKDLGFTDLRYTSFSIAPGCTYSMVFKHFFLNGTLAVGPAHNWIRSNTENGADKTETRINSFVAARIAIGYNGERLFGGVTFFTQGSNVKFDDTRFSNNNGTFKILIGYRFEEFGFLKRRVWDLIPFKI